MRGWAYPLIFALFLILAVAWGIANIFWAIDCGNRGGAYIIPQSGFPACLQGVK